MPELPDVEIFRRYMNSTSLHKKIENVDVKEEKLLGEINSRSLQIRLKDQQFESTMRHGKYLFAKTDNDEWLVLHFGMTGFLKYFKDFEESAEHIRLLIDFDNGFHLAFDCQRKLGLIDLVDDVKDFIDKKQLGIDPYREELDFKTFKNLVQDRRGTIKSFLMNQKLIAGLGNVYSDEVLFQAKVHPNSTARKLNDDKLESILNLIHQVIDTAIDKNADPKALPKTYLLPRRTPNAACPLCQGKIEKAKISGRSSYFCSNHQELIQ